MQPTARRRHRRALLAALTAATLAVAAAPAHAGLSTWTSLSGLSSTATQSDPFPDSTTDPSWVRAFATGKTPTTLYAGTEGAGVWKSVNDGLTWSHYSSGLDDDSLDVYQLFTNDGQIWAATSGGLWSAPDSTSSGGSWSPIAQGAETDPQNPTKLNNPVQAVVSVPGAMLAGTVSEGVYRSTDSGQTWQPPAANNGMPEDGLTVWSFAHFANFVWAATTDGIFRSTDSGATWTLSSDGIPESATTLGVVQDSTNPLIYYAETASDGLYRSIDGGTTWQSIDGDSGSEPFGGGEMPTIHAIQEFSGAGQTKLYVATSDGLWVGTLSNITIPGTGGKSLQVPGTPIWRNVTSQGFDVPNPIIWALSSFTTVPGTLLAGTQDNGGYSLTFQPPSNSGASQDLPSWLAAGIVPLDVGTQLVGTSGNWNGTPQIDYSWQWQSCTSTSAGSCTNIDGATDQVYTLAATDQGHYIREVVTAANDFPSLPKVPYTASSVIAGPVGAAPGPLPGSNQEDAPEITDLTGDSFEPNQGDTLAAPGGSAGGDGGWYFNPAGSQIGYQWLRCDPNGDDCVPIPGATKPTYIPVFADDDNTIAVQVSAENQYGQSAPLTSGATNPIIPLPAQATSPPQLSWNAHIGGTPAIDPTMGGNAYVGSTLVGDVGAWASPATYWTRQWMQCDPTGEDCAPIAGATGPEYVPTADDAGMTVELEVTAYVNPEDELPGPTVVDTPPSGVVTYPPASPLPPAPAPAPAPASPGPGPSAGAGPGAGAGSGSGSSSGTGSGSSSGSSGPSSGQSGSGSGTTPGSPVPVAPQLAGLKLGANGRSLSFTLSSAGEVTLLLQRVTKGHRVGVRCLTGVAHQKAKRCTRFATVTTVVHGALPAGRDSVALPTRVHGHVLPPGTYRVVLTAHGAGNSVGAAVTLTLALARS